MKRQSIFLTLLTSALLIALGIASSVGLSQAQGPVPEGHLSVQGNVGTAFLYRGRLMDSGHPANGLYDFRFRLYDAAIGGNQVGSTLTQGDVSVSNGLFTVTLDFGERAFNGEARWLEVAVRPGDSTGSYTTLSPRQPILPVPYALALPGLRVEQNDTSPNIIGGRVNNVVAPGVKGATISGGGAPDDGILWDDENAVGADYGTVGGGTGNRVAPGAEMATIGGGLANYAGDYAATIGGGALNEATGQRAVVAGGEGNVASGWGAVVGGGETNLAKGKFATVAGGGPTDSSDDPHATSNRAYDDYGTIGGGGNNRVGSDDNDTANATFATVGGGEANVASSKYATVGGGWRNTASGSRSTIAGGERNTASGYLATIGGGFGNTAGFRATVAGGDSNTASGSWSMIPGGSGNQAAGSYSFAAGRRAKATKNGCFVWGDSTNADVTCNSTNRTIFRSSGGFYIYTNSGLSSGARLSAGSGSWSNLSDRNAKANITPVDPQAVLERLASLPISTWNYKSQDPSIRHMGPMAQDFYAAFGLGEGDRYISSIDAEGVALTAIQGLYQRNRALEKKVEALQAENTALREHLADLETRLAALEQEMKDK